MRPSTIFILTVAILLGVAAAIAGRMAGLFGKLEEAAAAKRPPETLVLVASKPLFAGDVINPANVRTRALKPEEAAEFERRKDHYLPAVTQAVALRVAKKNIEADQPILKEYLEELGKPEPLNERLLPQMRVVNLSLPKEHAAGGLIQPGEWVDVLLTSNIELADGTRLTRTAVLANKVRVVTKRNVLWSVFEPLPADKPVEFIIEANPYRAALIEDAKKKGQITLTPIPAAEQTKLEKKREQAFENPNFVLVSFAETEGPELQDERERVEAFNRGQLVVGDADLARIFAIANPEPPPAPAKVTVERVFGHERKDPVEFSLLTGQVVGDTKVRTTRPATKTPSGKSILFHAPEVSPTATKRTASKS